MPIKKMLTKNLWTACVTPFNESGDEIDYESFENLLKKQDSIGNGVVILGSTGESLSLTEEERKDIAVFVCNMKLKIPIILGVPSHNMSVAVSWLDFANELPIDGYLMTTPIYTKPGVLGQTLWFEKLLNKSQKSSMLYNIPSRSGIKLHPETVGNLQDHENFIAIKDSSGVVDTLVEYKEKAPNISIFCGDDNMLCAMAAEGAVGLVSVLSNVWPEVAQYYVNYHINQKIKMPSNIKCKIEQNFWWKASKALFTASNPIPVKAILAKIGMIKNNTVRLPLSNKDLKSLDSLNEINDSMVQSLNLL